MAAPKKELENENQEQHGQMGVDEGENQSSNRISSEQTIVGRPGFSYPLL